jgi:hypothetical protein
VAVVRWLSGRPQAPRGSTLTPNVGSLWPHGLAGSRSLICADRGLLGGTRSGVPIAESGVNPEVLDVIGCARVLASAYGQGVLPSLPTFDPEGLRRIRLLRAARPVVEASGPRLVRATE